MIQRIFSFAALIQIGLSAGVLLGIGLIFLTLIGLPSDDSEQLAAITVELFIIITTYIGWRVARQYAERGLVLAITNAVAAGLAAGITLLLFLGLINSWHADGTDVEGLYFAKMNTYPMHVLSGVPLEELEPNPEPNPFTGELPEGAVLRTSPFQLSTDETISIFRLTIPFKIVLVDIQGTFESLFDNIFGNETETEDNNTTLSLGGFYGLLLLMVIGSGLGGALQLVAQRVNWEALREQQQQVDILRQIGVIVPHVFHWFILTLPLLIFILFWMTVEHKRSTEEAFYAVPLLDIQDATGIGIYDALIGTSGSNSFQPINLTEALNLTSDSLVDAPSLQLGIAFLVIISVMVALRRVSTAPTSLGYFPRMAIPFVIVSGLLLAAIIRIESSGVVVFAPSLDIFGLDAMGWTRLTFAIGALGVLLFIAIASRNPASFELVFALGIGATVFLISPLFMNQYQTFVMGRVMLAVMFGLGLNIVVGYAGLLDLGYVAFYAIGAYTFAFVAVESEQFKLTASQADLLGWAIVAALLLTPAIISLGLAVFHSAPHSESELTNAFGWKRKAPVWSAQPALVAISALLLVAIALALGFRDQLADGELLVAIGLGLFATDGSLYQFSPFLITIVMALLAGAFTGVLLGFPVLRLRGDYLAIVTLGFGEIISLALRNLDTTTGGPSGALGVPKPVPTGTSIPVSNLVLLYISILGAVLVSLVSLNLRNSRIGRAWLAIRSDEDIAQAMGINLVNLKLLAFSIGAAMAALAGMIFASRQNSIFPDDFNLEVSINVLSLVIIGGMGSVPGVVIGSIVLIGLPELLRPVEDYRIMAFGLLLILTMITRPQGLLPAPPPELEARAKALTAKAEQDNHD